MEACDHPSGSLRPLARWALGRSSVCLRNPRRGVSGYHMVVAAGVVFFLTRGVLALIPGLALWRPIKN